MLEAGKTYLDNSGKRVTIGGRIRDYGPDREFVWSIGGDWYCEKTGSFVWGRRTPDGYEHVVLSENSPKSILNHQEVDDEQL